MGTWGTGIFSDDLAEDVKNDYNSMLYYFEDDHEILEIMKARYSESFKYDEELSVFWYALAYSQWLKGRLDEDTKAQALYYIDNPERDGNLALWKEDKQLYNKRLKVLQNLKVKLNSPQPERKKYKLRQGVPARFETGDIVRYQLSEKEFKKFIKARDYLSEKNVQNLSPLFDGTYIYMIKLYDEEVALDSCLDFEEACKRNLTHHYEYFAIFKRFKKQPLTKEELYSSDIRYDHFIRFLNGETRRQDCFLFRLSTYDYLCNKNIKYGDEYFTFIDRFIKLNNDKILAEKLIIENDLNIEQQIDENYYSRPPLPYLDKSKYYICNTPIIFSIEYICPEIKR